jgi:hypothetical protein
MKPTRCSETSASEHYFSFILSRVVLGDLSGYKFSGMRFVTDLFIIIIIIIIITGGYCEAAVMSFVTILPLESDKSL